ncbi:hypothetical protein Acr_27g0001580 [Actinidia rufa]|uniref:Uncharacterized protein n=1 Tax=Actinidia rufa TaxID=165716 RepID=A0A7J0H5T7_9ERIC|nr:hypothetical protein Acr_27g0001580 [Actinidia rufa]
MPAWIARAITNPLCRASGEYRPAEFLPIWISARFLTISVSKEAICAISITAERQWHQVKKSSFGVSRPRNQARAKGTSPEVPDAILPRHRGNGPAKNIYATKVHNIPRKVRPEILRQSRQTDDTALEALGRTNVSGTSIEPRRSQKDSTVDHENRARRGINLVFKELIYKLLALIRHKSYFRKPEPLRGYPKRHNQRWKCSYHKIGTQ